MRTRAKSALGALLGPIALSEPDGDVALARRVAVAGALAVLGTA
jgi:hypothetical protein